MAPIGQLPPKKSNSSKSFFERIIPKKSTDNNDSSNDLALENNVEKTLVPKSEFINKYTCNDDGQRANSMNKLSERYVQLKKQQEINKEKFVQPVKEPGRLTIMQQEVEAHEKKVLHALQEIEIEKENIKLEKMAIKREKEELRIREEKIKIKEEQLNLCTDNEKVPAEKIPVNIKLIRDGLLDIIRTEFFNAKKCNTKLNVVRVKITVENTIQVAIDNVGIDKDRFLKIGSLTELKTEMINKLDMLSKNPSQFNLNQLFPERLTPQISKLTLK